MLSKINKSVSFNEANSHVKRRNVLHSGRLPIELERDTIIIDKGWTNRQIKISYQTKTIKITTVDIDTPILFPTGTFI